MRATMERHIRAIAGVCRADLGVAELQAEVLRRLRAVVPVDAAFFATVDPTTLLFTSAYADEPLAANTIRFIENEFAGRDVNTFTSLANGRLHVSTLDRATVEDRAASPRYREIMAPLSLGDELRAALVVGGCCWGVLCLHREDGPSGFSDVEVEVVDRLAGHLAEGLRRTVLVERAVAAPPSDAPGVVLLDDELTVVSCNPEGEYWLDQLVSRPPGPFGELPLVLHAVAAQAMAAEVAAVEQGLGPARAPRVRLRAADGRWLVVHASRLRGAGMSGTAVVIEAPGPGELTSLLLDAHGLTPAQSRVAALVLQGRSTQQIVNELRISANTVQEHLRAVFDKFGVGSRRELVTAVLAPAATKD